MPPLLSITDLQTALQSQHYIADRSLATSIFLALKLGKPLFLEGEAGVGKTEVAKVLAAVLARPLIRLQCYEGLDIDAAVYEWNYARQMLHIRLLEAGGEARTTQLTDLFGPDFLLKRPLLQAIDFAGGPAPVLLIDELDRADEEFEAFLLEILSDFQITIPEIGPIRAPSPPVVVLTSNRTREIHDALKRRCLYHWIDYPSFERECAIVLARAPESPQRLTETVVGFVQKLRHEDLYKKPGVAETLDWIHALDALDQQTLSEDTVHDTLGVLLKYQDDIAYVRDGRIARLLETTRR
ncbi:MAG: MoxR family ATPase [Caldilineales bacterium]|nr:MoxR family ATPase [Caldilineales bacterium]MCW5860330.1 MoxR family ATPase [Caldilineales bacterium]